MRTSFAILGVLTLLAACGDPLAGVPRLDEVELSETDPAAQALPTEAELVREGFFGTEAARAEVATGVPEAAAVPPPRRGGLLGLLRRAPRPEAAVPDPVPSGVEGAGQATAVEGSPATESDAPAASAGVVSAEVPARRSGLLGLFRPAAPSTNAVADTGAEVVAPVITDQEPAEVAALPQESGGRSGGLLSRLLQPQANGSDAASDLPEVSFGTVLPYGVIARSCSAKRQSLGRKVEGSTGGYKLYDSNPGATGLRTFYITGFGDGCPRQLTAAHVLLGAPSFYELLHYGPAGAHLAVGETDQAYEKVKGRVCGVRRGKPCGSRMGRLERNTVFVNAYPRSDDNTTWSEMLIHEGAVVAQADKSS